MLIIYYINTILMLSNSNSDFLPPVQENDFLPPIGRWAKVSGLFVVGAMGIAVALASITQYKVTIKAQATVRPVGELRLVQAATKGSVMQIFAAENQAIKKGDIIATLDDSRLQTQKSQLQNKIQQAQLQLLQINAQIRALDRQILAETDRISRAVASAEGELSHRLRNYQDKKITTVAQVQEAKANLMQAQEELQKAEAKLRSTKANFKSAEASLKAARVRRKRYQPIASSGALSQERFEEAQLNVEQQEQAMEGQKASVEAQQQTIEQQQQAVEATRARLQVAQTALNPSDAEVVIASERIAQETAMGKATLATLNREREALIQQQIQIQNQLERDTRELQQLEIDLSKTTITATADGIISKLNLRNSGQTVQPGEYIAQIAPSNTQLVIKALVSAGDIGKVETGQKAQLRVSACPYPDYGTLKGQVSTISPDALGKAVPQAFASPNNGTAAFPATTGLSQKGGTAMTFYQVTIKPHSLTLGEGKNQCSIQLGMEGRADIISREETALKFLLRKARLITDL